MKTSEFIKEIESYCNWLNSKADSKGVSYKVGNDPWNNIVLKKHETITFPMLHVSKGEVNDYSFVFSPGVNINDTETARMLGVLVDYAATPLKERKDEQRWYIHLFEDTDGYLNLQKDEGFYELSTKMETVSHKTKFTRSEIEDWAGTNSDEIIDWIIDKFGEEAE